MGKATKPTFAKLKGYDQVRASQSLPCSVAILRRSPHILRANSENQSAKFFGIRFRSVFPEFELQVIAKELPDVDTELKHVANAYYREIRCGLFHDAMTRTGTVVVKGADHTLQVSCGNVALCSSHGTQRRRSATSRSTECRSTRRVPCFVIPSR